ncbi:MAG TPA: hypothetical protein VG895_02725 [Patescibacteria group bacterium]|nr:hypothetical protein [Patescibacteria group bacterium]
MRCENDPFRVEVHTSNEIFESQISEKEFYSLIIKLRERQDDAKPLKLRISFVDCDAVLYVMDVFTEAEDYCRCVENFFDYSYN